MVIDLKRFFQAEGAEDRFRWALDFSGVELGGAKPFCAPVEIQARLKSFAGAVSFLARADFVMAMPCDRCAEEFTREYHKEFAHTLVRESERAEDDEDFILVPEEKLDVDRLILSTSSLSWRIFCWICRDSFCAGRIAWGFAPAAAKT